MALKSRALFCDGNVFLNPRTETTLTDKVIGPVYTNGFKLKINNEQMKIPNKQLGKSGTNAEIITRGQPSELSLPFNKLPFDILANIFAGNIETVAVAEATATGKTLQMYVDHWTQVLDASGKPARNLVAVTHATHVEGTAFEVNRRAGLIRAITGGGITDNTAVSGFGYTLAAVAGKRIKAGTKTTHAYQVTLDGSYISDRASLVYGLIPYVQLAASADIEIFPDKPNDIDLKGELVWLDDETGEFYWDGDLVYSDAA